MTAAVEKVVTRHWGKPDQHTLKGYKASGGYQQLKKVLELSPDAVTQEVKKSNLRGRGGAGFPTGMKWSFVPKDSPKPKYLAINADESEPGTAKDRFILENDPHSMLEGIAIACWALGARSPPSSRFKNPMSNLRLFSRAAVAATPAASVRCVTPRWPAPR